MWHWFKESMQQHPELAIFMTMALGFTIGRLRFKSVALGAVTGTLLAGVLVGQLDVQIPALVKTVAFVGFLFTLGYSVGPQFFAGLRGSGLPQLGLALFSCLVGLGTAFAVAKILGYGVGWGAGLLAGGLTQSAVIGVAGDAISHLPGMTPDQLNTYNSQIAVGYAVCYLVGTAVAAYFLSSIAPRLMGTKDLAAECQVMESELGVASDPDVQKAYYSVVRRSYKVDNPAYTGKSVAAIEDAAKAEGARIVLHRVRAGGPDAQVATVTPDTVIHRGDVVSVTTRRADLETAHVAEIGPETNDPQILDYQVETLPIVVTQKKLVGRTIGEVFAELGPRVFVNKVVRGSVEIPWSDKTEIHRGDEITVQGAKEFVEDAVKKIGYPARSDVSSDYRYIGLGILIGGLIGIPTIAIAGADIGLTTSGGALIMGLIFGWLRSRNPTFGNFPAPAQWILNTGGLCMFVGIVGISSGPDFISGVKQEGLSLVLGGLIVTLMPMITSLYLGKYLFKFRTPILLGVVAGANTTTASIGAICDQAKSRVPVLGYTIPYALGNTLLTIWGTVIVALLA